MSSAGSYRPQGRGPFRVDQLRPGDPYELSDGHAIVCEPSGRRHARRNLAAGAMIDSDPAVEAAAVDAGFVLDDATLRAPDVSAGNLADEPGFAPGAPSLALEYVDRGRDETDLERKIAELLSAGTEVVWVVRLGGPRRVEVHRPGQAMAVKGSGETLVAPGLLHNPVPVDALYDRQLAHEITLRNLLQRRGYESLEAVREAGWQAGRTEGRTEGWTEGRTEGQAEGLAEGVARGTVEGALRYARERLRRTLAVRGLEIAEHEAAIDACRDLATLDLWLDRALTATSTDAIFFRG